MCRGTVRDMEPMPALRPLLMDAKPLAALMKRHDKWTDLAARLKSAFPAQPKSSPNANEVIHLCGVYYAHDREPFIFSYDYHYKARVEEDVFNGLVADTVAFLEEFMDDRGQWGYIKQQAWYKNREYVIGIDVNYYPDRSSSLYTMSPQFHKDTGGNNLFVNLIFDNKQPIEATEWFVDVQEPSGKRAAWQRQLLPPAHLKELDALRQELRDSGQYRTPVVHGGVLKGDDIYVSWVDDLVWHATPSLNQRIKYSSAAAVAAYPSVKAAVQNGTTIAFADVTGAVRIHAVELLATIADDLETELAKWLVGNDKNLQDLDFELARIVWFALYNGDAGKARFTSDAQLRGRAEWRLLGQVAEAIATDVRLNQAAVKAPNITETPAGLSKVQRANSVGSDELRAVAAANQGVPRSFLRTWVRIMTKDATELSQKGFTFK
jgi:hypothetical protein